MSIVVPALNSATTISGTLSSIFANEAYGEAFEVLVVDNGSRDATVDIAQKFPVKIYRCSRRGIGPPRNLGIQKAQGDIVCFTDSDCIVEKYWTGKISDFFNRNPEADGVGGPVFPYPYGQNKIQKLTGTIFVEDQEYPKNTRKIRPGSMNGIIFGSNSAYRRSVLMESGGFVEPGGSNLELALRLTALGKNLFFDPEIKAYHVFPGYIKTVLKQQFRWGSQLTRLERTHNTNMGGAEIVMISYPLLVKSLSQFFSHGGLDKKVLHLVQIASFGLGRINGYNTLETA
jgi:glycosyltransferase involved in cell wall biosynthesis